MPEIVRLSRRRFLQVTTAAGGGLLLGFHLPLSAEKASPQSTADTEFVPNAWLRIDTDDAVTVIVASSEMGQGVMTSIPMLVAEELDADWSKIRAEFAPVKQDYINPIMGRQHTGGSTAVRGFYRIVREAGAAAREMLVQAAALQWRVDAESCRARNGAVEHNESGRRLTYGQLAAKAATLRAPEVVFLKEPDQFKLLGKPIPRLDGPSKVNGTATFGQDVRLPDLVVATVIRCPVFGGKAKHVDAERAKAIKGVIDVVSIESGVAIVAEASWPALRAREQLEIEWDEGANAALSSAKITSQFVQAVKDGTVARDVGNAEQVIAEAPKSLEAVYEVPYLAHACMEPMNCTAHVRSDECEIWAPTQAQTSTQQTASRITGLPLERVHVHTTFLGGGFGRRSEQDFIADALELSKKMGKPVQVMWTREDDIQHDHYRPATHNRLSAALDSNGMPIGWVHRIAGPSILSRFRAAEPGAVDRTSVEGAANIPYAIPNIHVTYAMVDPGIPVGFWRSVGSSQNAFITECFLDELAAAGGKDPYELRRTLLKDAPRHKAVLELAAAKAGWGQPLPGGRHRGIAVAESFRSFVAQVAEVSVNQGAIRVHRVVCAIDCGMIVNPDTIAAQMESGIVYGLTAALKGEITIENGRVVQSNFDDYPALKIDEMPEVETHIVQSGEDPGGVGEPGTPPIAPAVANAVFAATGIPIRRLPIRL